MATSTIKESPQSKSEVLVTASTNVVIDTNKSYRLGKILFLNVKGHTTANISNATLFIFAGANANPNGFTFGIPIGDAWGINSIAYGYLGSNSVNASILSGKYFHIAQAFICN